MTRIVTRPSVGASMLGGSITVTVWYGAACPLD